MAVETCRIRPSLALLVSFSSLTRPGTIRQKRMSVFCSGLTVLH